MAVLRQFRPIMAADRRLGCLSIFLFVALCASLFLNFVLMVAAFQRFAGVREPEPIPRFREILLQRGTHGTADKVAVITMRGLISSSLPGAVTDSMVDDMRAALQQARDDDLQRSGQSTREEAGRGLHGIARGLGRLLRFMRRQIFDGKRNDNHR